MLIDIVRYELPPEGTTLLGYIVRRMHKTEWLMKAVGFLKEGKTAEALEAAAFYAIASATSFGQAYYQPQFNRVGDVVQECDPATGVKVTARLEQSSPHYHIAYSAVLKSGEKFEGSETILGTTIGFRGLGMPTPSKFTFTAGEYQADFNGTITSELALLFFGNTKIRAYGSLDFKDSAGNFGHLDLNRQGYVGLSVNDKPAATYALVRVMWRDVTNFSPKFS